MLKTVRILLIFTILTALTVPSITSAQGVRRSPVLQGVKRLIAQTEQSPEEEPVKEEVLIKEVEPVKEVEPEVTACDYEKPEKEELNAQFIALRKKGSAQKGELFETKMYIRNIGNVPWFSAKSGCPGPQVNLGTDNDRDRTSLFFADDLMWESGWEKANRIAMTSKRVDPGQLAEFTFWSRAPYEDGYFREIYTPVAEGYTWMEGGTATSDIRVGVGKIPLENKDLLQYIQTSTNLSKFDLVGDKWIEVDISSQRMRLMVGDYVIRNFPVSTGTYRTPTPFGETHIFQKQEVRVASGSPHYIMPKWMHFRAGGYGIHALPSLGNDNGVYWREALNHIGTRRSHGCIRLLPNDAVFAYEFADIGTKVKVIP